jgi:DNA-binding response OmpR family regulator
MRILVVDDDPRVLASIASILRGEGHYAVLAGSGAQALEALRAPGARRPDLAVLDVAMPGMDGFEVCRTIRATADIPALFLPARDQEIASLLRQGFRNFDYAAKPLSPPELLGRVRALRRSDAGDAFFPETLRHGRLCLRPGDTFASWDGTSVPLDRTGMLTLEMMLRQPSRLFSRESIMVVAYGEEVNPVLVDRHVEELCRKFRDAGCPEVIGIVCGVGFTLVRAD